MTKVQFVFLYFLSQDKKHHSDFFFFFGRAVQHAVPQPGIEPTPPVVEAWSLNHWTTREVPHHSDF